MCCMRWAKPTRKATRSPTLNLFLGRPHLLESVSVQSVAAIVAIPGFSDSLMRREYRFSAVLCICFKGPQRFSAYGKFPGGSEAASVSTHLRSESSMALSEAGKEIWQLPSLLQRKEEGKKVAWWLTNSFKKTVSSSQILRAVHLHKSTLPSTGLLFNLLHTPLKSKDLLLQRPQVFFLLCCCLIEPSDRCNERERCKSHFANML